QFRRDGPPYGPLAFIDFNVYTRLVDSFPNLSELQLQGMGEPMMHPRFFDMVAYAAGKGIEVSTNSNLTLLSERRAHLCVLSGLGYLHVSLDGASAETYEAIRVRARFDRVLRNLRHLIEARRQAASELPRVRLVAVAMRTNLHELPRWCTSRMSTASTRCLSSISATTSPRRACRHTTARCASLSNARPCSMSSL